MKTKRKRMLLGCVVAVLFILAAGVVFKPSSLQRDLTSGAVREVRFWGVIPLGSKIIRAPTNYDPETARWAAGVQAAFVTPIRVGQIFAFRSRDYRAAVRIVKLEAEAGELGYAVYSLGERKWVNITILSDPIKLEHGFELHWSLAAQDALFIHSDDYLKTPSNLLYAVSYPMEQDDAVAFVEGRASITNWFRFPWDAK